MTEKKPTHHHPKKAHKKAHSDPCSCHHKKGTHGDVDMGGVGVSILKNTLNTLQSDLAANPNLDRTGVTKLASYAAANTAAQSMTSVGPPTIGNDAAGQTCRKALAYIIDLQPYNLNTLQSSLHTALSYPYGSAGMKKSA